jgi:hypothetical protein
MTRAKSLKHFVAKAEELRKKRLPSKMKKTRRRYNHNFRHPLKLLKIQSKEDMFVSKSSKAVLLSEKENSNKKSNRKRYNAMAYFKRKAKKPRSLGTPEKRKRLTDVYNFNPELVYDMDRFEVNFIFYI